MKNNQKSLNIKKYVQPSFLIIEIENMHIVF